LRIKIKEIPDEGMILDQPIEAGLLGDALAGSDAELDRSAGAVRLQIYKNGEDVVVSGRVKATLGLPCGLCLAPARVDFDVPVKAVFRPEPDDDSDEDLDAEDVYPHDRKMVELDKLVREIVILSVPISVKCKESCRGLCPECGADRNVTDCGHTVRRDEAVPKLAALKDLKPS